MKTDASSQLKLLIDSAPGWIAVSRGCAFGLSLLITMNLTEIFVHSTSAVHNWLADLSLLTQPVALTILVMSATALCMFSIKPTLPVPVQLITLALLVGVGGFCGREAWLISNVVEPVHSVAARMKPVGTMVLLTVAGIGVALGNSERVRGKSSLFAIVISALLTIQAFAVVAVQSGSVSDRLSDPLSVANSTAPVIVVMGAPLQGTGELAESVANSVTASVEMLQLGHGRNLMLLGVSPRNAPAEIEAMRSLAETSGADASRILTEADHAQVFDALLSLATREELADDKRIVLVASPPELARLRMLARRAGLQPAAIAAPQQPASHGHQAFIAKECAAFLWTMVAPTVHSLRNAVLNSLSPKQSATD